MDSIVEENGNSNNVDEGHNLSTAQQQSNNSTNSTTINVPPPPSSSVLTTTSNVVQYLPPHGLQSVIQAANQSSVIQTAATTNAMSKNVVFVSKPNTTVIHTTSGNAVQIKPEPNTHHLDSNSEDSLTDEDSPRRHRELTRRPSYHKIFTEISGPDISGGSALQMSESSALHAMASAGGSTSGSLMHLQQDSAPQFYLPNNRMAYNANNSGIAEDQTRKREIRLQKNREAARECRRKKKEYIKCLENRVAVLENQNKALIEELKSLKELYCQSKND
ncbi:cyclic AMP response element-binding protein B-like isoform X2 [Teleopsis dalmanni]|uniref:cyclic AMP response element-binding protein B-like isoform X2 n=1 Tax=Teleopsis dalmanni TaxID=139649 RepID=UPI0018CF13F6|nr:cyclic AMP response element-binding protein B-like isoform X2 [Teleopsis dalmanni]XP_037937775.1 cyclic AMP response element-binding protein B-like isoform X2 [Teleopsis dalmanni]